MNPGKFRIKTSWLLRVNQTSWWIETSCRIDDLRDPGASTRQVRTAGPLMCSDHHKTASAITSYQRLPYPVPLPPLSPNTIRFFPLPKNPHPHHNDTTCRQSRIRHAASFEFPHFCRLHDITDKHTKWRKFPERTQWKYANHMEVERHKNAFESLLFSINMYETFSINDPLQLLSHL